MAPTSRAPHGSGIKIEDDPRNITPLPPHAKELRDMLLNFEGVVPLNKKFELQGWCRGDFDPRDTEYQPPDTIHSKLGHPTHLPRWIAAEDLVNKARDLGPDHSEDDWQHMMSSYVFQTINNQASARVIPLRDLVSWGSNQPFTNAISMRGLLDETQPKPDYWFGLGLYNDEQLERLKGLELADKGIRYFTQRGLKQIKCHHDRFVCQPVKSKEYAGFPWMVAELKKQNGDESYCLRQAANASHACLVLCERLAEKGGRDGSPIVAFTSIGPQAKLFITYRSGTAEDPRYRMSCIWSGDIGKMLHAIQIRCIADKLLFWALRHFKPWVTECLEHWHVRDTKSSIREHKSTQTLGYDTVSPTPRVRYGFDGSRSERNYSSRSDTADSHKRSTLSVPVTGRSRSSTSEARNRFQDPNPSATNRSHRSHSSESRAVDSEPSPHSTMPSQKGSDRSTSEADTRLLNIRARVREACVRSLILTNRVHSLVQQITLEQIRAQGS